MLSNYSTTKKSADARFFGPFHKFFLFFKMSKIQKKRKNVPKIAFFLMLCCAFCYILMLPEMILYFHFMSQYKNTKKHGKKYLKLFLKNENWTFIFVHFLYFKKSFKNKKILYIFLEKWN
jgi:amino acid transporter